MGIVFSHPWGLLALLGIPLLLLIHLLQRQSRRVLTSTLFLLEHLTPLSVQGRRIERLRNSLPLWLQILAVLLLAWLLAGPTWPRKDSQQLLVVVLDSSLSMRAFHEDMLEKLRSRLSEIDRAAAHSQWILLESDPSQATLYSGPHLAELLAKLETWSPNLGTHDFAPALQTARSLLSGNGNGLIILVSDRKSALPEGVESLRVGHPIPNCGFIGSRVDGETWTALVRNYGADVQSRKWWVASEASQSTPQELTLQPGETVQLKGRFPDGQDRCTLVLSGDEFTPDDRLPLVLERLKTLNIANTGAESERVFFERFASSIQDVVPGASPVDIELGSYDPLAPRPLAAQAIVAVSDPGPGGAYRQGSLVKERHPLTEDLNFQGLIVRDGLGIPPREDDQVLLWQGSEPLIFLRPAEGGQSLTINFDLSASNADRLPSFIVLLNRFVESVRAAKIGFEQKNFESNQRLQVAHDAGGPPLEGGREGAVLRAPFEPSFFEISQDGKTLLSGAAQFADVREADFRDAESGDSTELRVRDMAEKSRRGDFLTPLWLLLLGAVCLGNWAVTERRSRG